MTFLPARQRRSPFPVLWLLALMALGLPSLVLLFFATARGNASDARRPGKTCNWGEIKSISVQRMVFSHLSPGLGIYAQPTRKELGPSVSLERSLELLVVGPVLSLLDSEDIQTEVSCTKRGFVVTASITHIDGAALKNPPWLPGLKILGIKKRPALTAQVRWRMHLDDGTQLDHVPGDPSTRLPLLVTKEIH
jgi:hypothetical protein